MTLFHEFIKFSLGKGETLSHKLTEQVGFRSMQRRNANHCSVFLWMVWSVL